VNAILSASTLEELEKLRATLDGCQKAFKSIESIMSDKGGSEAAPDFTALLPIIARTTITVASHIQSRAPAETAGGSDGAAQGEGGAAIGRGPIRSRDDAVRALDAIAAFFRSSEPSSPVPLFVERAKRLVAKDFLAVLEDIAPDAVSQVKVVGGVRDSE
jgi:type VI secretion system protein ImpA